METTSNPLSVRFRLLAEKYLPRLRVRGHKGISLCPFHVENTPSFSVDFDKGVFHCFGCGKGGGVKDFALAVGEKWGRKRYNSRQRARSAVQVRRRQAEEQAHAILERRKDERETTLWMQYFEANDAATEAAELLALFHRRPDLAEDFSPLAARTEREYGYAVSRRALLEAQIAEEVEVMA